MSRVSLARNFTSWYGRSPMSTLAPKYGLSECRHGEDLPQTASTEALAGLRGQKGCRAEGQGDSVTEIGRLIPQRNFSKLRFIVGW